MSKDSKENRKSLYLFVGLCSGIVLAVWTAIVAVVLVWYLRSQEPDSLADDSTAENESQQVSGPPSQSSSGGRIIDEENLRNLVVQGNIANLRQLVNQHGKPDSQVLVRILTQAILTQSDKVLVAFLPEASEHLNAFEQSQLSHNLTRYFGSASPESVELILQFPHNIPTRTLENRMVQTCVRAPKIAEKIHDAIKSEIQPATWQQVFQILKSKADWERWLAKFEKYPPQYKSQVAELSLPRLIDYSVPEQGMPFWWPLMELQSNDSFSHKLASKALQSNGNKILAKYCIETGVPKQFLNSQTLRRLFQLEPQLFRQFLPKVPMEQSYQYFRSDVLTAKLENLEDKWGKEWIQKLINEPDPSQPRNPQTLMQRALARYEWPQVEWLLDQGASVPDNLYPVQSLFVSIVNGDPQAVEATLDDLNNIHGREYTQREKEQAFGVFKRSKHVHFDPFLVALRRSNLNVFVALLRRVEMIQPEKVISAAKDAQQWIFVRQMVTNGIKIPAETIADIARHNETQAATIFGSSQPGTASALISSLPTILLDDIGQNDLPKFEADLRRLLNFGRQYSKSNSTHLSLQELFEKTQADEEDPLSVQVIVRAALSRPRFLSKLQALGFPIEFDDLVFAINEANPAAVEICLRSILHMELRPDQADNLVRLGKLSRIERIQQLMKSTGL